MKVKPRKPLEELLPHDDSEIPYTLALMGQLVFVVTLVAYTTVVLLGDTLFLPRDAAKWCVAARSGYPVVKRYDNPDCDANPCYRERPWQLLFVSPMECDFARRMLLSVAMGSAIGFERKSADRPAGIRTMSLVCLGSSFFTMCSQMAFMSSTMGWDAARVSAAIPAGVGFIGSALIWKGTMGEKGTPDERREVHGLTTAASVWLSAAVGIGIGGKLTIVSIYAVALVILVLRMGPRMYFTNDSSSCGDSESELNFSDSVTSSDTDTDEDKYNPKRGAKSKMMKISSDEQMRLLMGISAETFYGESQRSLLDGSGPPSKLDPCKFMSTPNLASIDRPDMFTEPEVLTRSGSATLEGTAQYEIPVKDYSNTPSKRHRRRKKHRRGARSLSPNKRPSRVNFLS